MIDIGANLVDRAFDGDRDTVLGRARDAGVTGIVVTGTDVAGSRRAAEFAAAHPGYLWATAGVHPHYAAGCDERTPDALTELAASDAVVAIGETGLDFYRDLSPRPVQIRWFERQLDLAIALDLPAFLHQRDAADAFLGVVGERAGRVRGVLHCFTDSAATLEAALGLGLSIGITGWICDERRGRDLAAIVDRIPDDRLLIETDAPYLLPRSIRPRPKTRRNEPHWLGEVCRAVAEHRGQSVEHVAAITTANARALFALG